ncbi:hypothetical protein [Roseinatronobacter sp.]|uniref:hypothetical protein n=1 Tax=Roseinatronobacter sp. TaxID=1945755 RepID=UPI0025FF5D8D|nr:hypothetical protein [Roseibaca sp.]
MFEGFDAKEWMKEIELSHVSMNSKFNKENTTTGCAGESVFFSGGVPMDACRTMGTYPFNDDLYFWTFKGFVSVIPACQLITDDIARDEIRSLIGRRFKAFMGRDITDEEIEEIIESEDTGESIKYEHDEDYVNMCDILNHDHDFGWEAQRIQAELAGRMGVDFVEGIDEQGTVFITDQSQNDVFERIIDNMVLIGSYEDLEEREEEIDNEIDENGIRDIHEWALKNGAKRNSEI